MTDKETEKAVDQLNKIHDNNLKQFAELKGFIQSLVDTLDKRSDIEQIINNLVLLRDNDLHLYNEAVKMINKGYAEIDDADIIPFRKK